MVKLGYTGSCDLGAGMEGRAAACASHERSGACVSLAFTPGEAFEFDWSEARTYLAASPSCYKLPILGCRTAAPFLCGRTHRNKIMVAMANNLTRIVRPFRPIPARSICSRRSRP